MPSNKDQRAKTRRFLEDLANAGSHIRVFNSDSPTVPPLEKRKIKVICTEKNDKSPFVHIVPSFLGQRLTYFYSISAAKDRPLTVDMFAANSNTGYVGLSSGTNYNLYFTQDFLPGELRERLSDSEEFDISDIFGINY